MKWSTVRESIGPVFGSLVLHGAIVVFLLVSFSFPSSTAMPPQVSVKARVVSEEKIREEMAALDALERKEERERAAEAERLRQEAEQERSRLAQLEQERQEAERERVAAAERERVRQETAAREEQARKDAAAKAERERKEREAAEQARLAELERQRKAEEERLAKIREEQRQAEEARKREEERRQAEAAAREKARVEAELQAQIALEEQRMAAERSGLLGQYIALIQQRVTRSWIRPPEAQPGLDCEVYVQQIPGGDVVDVRIGRCNGSDVVKRSIESAVYRASPLPGPPDPSLFERNLVFDFKPED
jgi:colicin import membrane protein